MHMFPPRETQQDISFFFNGQESAAPYRPSEPYLAVQRTDNWEKNPGKETRANRYR